MIYIPVEVVLGVSIEEATKEAQALAMRVQTPVEFKFNGVTFFVHPTSDPEELSKKYYLALHSRSKGAKYVG